jgi:hypothetical protein
MNTPTVQTEPVPGAVQPSTGNGAPGRMTDQRRAFSTPELAFLIGVPLAWAALLLFHPGGEGTEITYREVQDEVTAWLAVHIGMMLFIRCRGSVSAFSSTR